MQFLAGAAVAQVVLWHPWSNMRLGSTFDPKQPAKPKEPCLNTTSNTTRLPSPASTLSFESVILKSHDQLFGALSISPIYAAIYDLLPDSASGLPIDALSHQRTVVDWMVVVKRAVGRTRLSAIEYMPGYLQLSEKIPEEEFIERCGSHYVESETYEGVSVVIFHVDVSPADTRSELVSVLQEPWFDGGPVPTNIRKVLESLPSGSTTSYTLLSRESTMIKRVDGIVKSIDQFDKLIEQATAKVGSAAAESVSSYTVQPLPQFAGKIQIPARKERAIAKLFFEFIGAKTNLDNHSHP